MQNGIAFALIAGGIVVAVVGYVGVSGETEVAFQLPYFASAAVGALMMLGGGGALLVAGQLRRDDDRFDQLEGAVRDLATEVGRLADQVAIPRGSAAPGSNGGPKRESARKPRAKGGAP